MRMADDDRERSARETPSVDRRRALSVRVFDDPGRDRRRGVGCARRRAALGDAFRVDGLPARAARVGERRRATPAGRRTSSPSSAPASSSPRVRSTSRTTRTASTCSTGPGPTRTGATASSTTRSCSTRSPFTPVPGPRLLARSPSTGCVLLRAIEQLARSAGLSSAHLLFLDDADQAAARAAGWSLRSTVQFHWTQPRAHAVRRLRRLPRRPAARQAQEDPAGAAPRRRGRRPLQRSRAARRSPRRLGLLLPLLHAHLPRAPLDAVPDARLLRALGGDDGAALAALHRLARRQAGSRRR